MGMSRNQFIDLRKKILPDEPSEEIFGERNLQYDITKTKGSNTLQGFGVSMLVQLKSENGQFISIKETKDIVSEFVNHSEYPITRTIYNEFDLYSNYKHYVLKVTTTFHGDADCLGIFRVCLWISKNKTRKTIKKGEGMCSECFRGGHHAEDCCRSEGIARVDLHWRCRDYHEENSLIEPVSPCFFL